MRKKRLIKPFMATLFSVAASFMFITIGPVEDFSSLTLENIEALSQDDGFTIICGSRKTKGKCWRRGSDLKYKGEYSYYECVFTGAMIDFCTQP
ncbi:MAG: hypothetical protein E7103_02005 [Prevotella sp.]|jgi:hypothetical protein|nr:hypothetical protein [Prevotella sp.]